MVRSRGSLCWARAPHLGHSLRAEAGWRLAANGLANYSEWPGQLQEPSESSRPRNLIPGKVDLDLHLVVNELRQTLLASIDVDDVYVLRDKSGGAALASRLARSFAQATVGTRSDGWLDFDGAIELLGMKSGTLYKLTSARTIPFHQNGPGCKLWFVRSELDQWRRKSGTGKARSTHLRAPSSNACFQNASMSPESARGEIRLERRKARICGPFY